MSVLKKFFVAFCIMIDFYFSCRLQLKKMEKIIRLKLSNSEGSSSSNFSVNLEKQRQVDFMDLFLQKFFEDVGMNKRKLVDDNHVKALELKKNLRA